MEAIIPHLRCPVTHLALDMLTQKEMFELNKRVDRGDILHCHGAPSVKTLVETLKVKGRELYYPIIDDIICLLPHLSLMGRSEPIRLNLELDGVKQQLQDFYNEIGWHKEARHFKDAVDSEDLRPVSKEYIHRCHQRVKKHLAPNGTFLLDVASGPIQYEDYLSYSEHYQYRVCADLSVQGLREAQAKLGAKGIYILCDITALPFQENTFEGIVSLHTIYHIPQAQQAHAFFEIYRVLKPEHSMVVVYSWGGRSLLMNLFLFPWKLYRKLQEAHIQSAHQQPIIYFYAHSFGWFQKEIASRYPVKLWPWRSVNVPFLKKFCHDYLFGKRFLCGIYWLEEKYPFWMARLGAYPMMVFKKN